MRYLIDPEYREVVPARPRPGVRGLSSALRQELSVRNLHWAKSRNYAHEVSLGSVPAVLYREDEAGVHGNFLSASYDAIKAAAPWRRRLDKVHTSARRTLLSRDTDRRELDSSNSSDALLMNVFCHPETLKSQDVCALLGIDAGVAAEFGYKPGIALKTGRRDPTEIDLKLGTLFIEAKLTEADFTSAPMRLIERYRDLETTFNVDLLDIDEANRVGSYQLIRGILFVAATEEGRFCVLCDARRTDLIHGWHRVIRAVRPYDLRCRLQLLTWQELAKCLSFDLRQFLDEKYGI